MMGDEYKYTLTQSVSVMILCPIRQVVMADGCERLVLQVSDKVTNETVHSLSVGSKLCNYVHPLSMAAILSL